MKGVVGDACIVYCLIGIGLYLLGGVQCLWVGDFDHLINSFWLISVVTCILGYCWSSCGL
jgi:hypothetical protein